MLALRNSCGVAARSELRADFGEQYEVGLMPSTSKRFRAVWTCPSTSSERSRTKRMGLAREPEPRPKKARSAHNETEVQDNFEGTGKETEYMPQMR